MLGLTVRGRYADIFWFSLFHELYHILEGHIYNIDPTTDVEEAAADIFARNTLIVLGCFLPKNHYLFEVN